MDQRSPTESSCPWAQCPGQLSFSDLDDTDWMVSLLDALVRDSWVVVYRYGGTVVMEHLGHTPLDTAVRLDH